jgi:antitoxin MazE
VSALYILGIKGIAQMQTTIQKWGNSQAERLPEVIPELANMHGNDSVRITAEQDKIIIVRETNPRTNWRVTF